MKKVISILPETFLMAGVIYYWFSVASVFNPIAIILFLLLGFTLFFKNATLAVFTSAILGLLSLYMILAVISEFREFETGDTEGIKLLTTGLLLFLATFIMSIIMGVKHLIKKAV